MLRLFFIREQKEHKRKLSELSKYEQYTIINKVKYKNI